METATMVRDLASVMEPLADKLGEAAQFLWAATLKQMMVEAWLNVMLAVLWCIPIVVIVVALRKMWAAYHSESSDFGEAHDDESVAAACTVAGIFVSVLLTIVVWQFVGYALRYAISPEFMALETLLNTVTQGG